QKQWDLVQFMEMNVFVDDGEGFIDLGLDNVYEYNGAGDLILEYDGTWLALNGHIVSYYMMSDDHHGDSYTIKGRVPAKLNGQLVDIILVFDDQRPYGVVLGAQKRYDPKTQTETVPKGLIDIVAGDEIDYLCDYYTYEGGYSNTYLLGEQYTATGEWQIENLSVGQSGYQMTYRITDIYGNRYWTPSVTD
ncbi:MAG TPA: peptidase C11, partial [Coriobacteriia bacterium]|nr:peptidase C11 [Coriobacteriia bacterium]